MRAASLFAFALTLAAAGASAQEDPASPPTDGPTLSTEEARGAFEAGTAAYEAGRFPQALEYFERAYELTEEPDILYNVATVHDRLRHDAEALEGYRAYLEARPDSPDRANIEARIAALEEAIARAEAPPEPEPEPAPPAPEPPARIAPPPPPGPPVGGIALVAAGAGLALAGGGLLVWALVDHVAIEGASGEPYDQIRDAYERVPFVSAVGYAAAGVGVALLVGGAIWLAVGDGDGGPEVALRPGGLALRGRFE